MNEYTLSAVRENTCSQQLSSVGHSFTCRARGFKDFNFFISQIGNEEE